MIIKKYWKKSAEEKDRTIADLRAQIVQQHEAEQAAQDSCENCGTMTPQLVACGYCGHCKVPIKTKQVAQPAGKFEALLADIEGCLALAETYKNDVSTSNEVQIASCKTILFDIGIYFAALKQSLAQPPSQTPCHEQNARFAIDGAIQYGRMGINKPPTEDHWLMEYWLIGQSLAQPAPAQWQGEVDAQELDRARKAPAQPVSVPVYFFRQKVGGSWLETSLINVERLQGAEQLKDVFEFRILYTAPQPPAQPAKVRDDRALFEEASRDIHDSHDFVLSELRGYSNNSIHDAWVGWQAAVKSMEGGE